MAHGPHMFVIPMPPAAIAAASNTASTIRKISHRKFCPMRESNHGANPAASAVFALESNSQLECA